MEKQKKIQGRFPKLSLVRKVLMALANFHLDPDTIDVLPQYVKPHTPTPRESKKKKRKERQEQQKNHLSLKEVKPKTKNQQLAYDYFMDDFNLVMHGMAGTGKTFLSLYLALNDLFDREISEIQSVTICRSVVPSRDVGFLPGNVQEKASVYEEPYRSICAELFNRGDAYDILAKRGDINFVTTSFLRGSTLSNTILILDEVQNMTFQEIDTVLTRIGKDSRVIVCGDFRQDDLRGKKGEHSGFNRMFNVLKEMDSFKTVDFKIDDIVRSGFVRDYLIAKDKIGESL